MNLYIKTSNQGIQWNYWDGNKQNFLETQSGNINTIAGLQVFTVNVLFAFPIIVKEDVTINDVQIAYSSSVAGNSVFGIYDMLNGLPNNLIFQTTPFDNAVTGTQIDVLPSQVTIKKGIYFIAYNTSSVPNLYYFPIYVVPNIFGSSFSNLKSNSTIRLTNPYPYTGTLPTTFGGPVQATNANYVPAVLFTIL